MSSSENIYKHRECDPNVIYIEVEKNTQNIEAALQLNTVCQRDAFDVLNDKKYARQFKNSKQVDALEFLGPAFYKDALKFNNPYQVDALYFLKAEHREDALKFNNSYQVEALYLLGAEHREDALKFTNPYQVDALERFGGEDLDAVLNYHYWRYNKALKILVEGSDKVALKFNNWYQINALEKLGPKHVDVALKFTTNIQHMALQALGPKRVECAASVNSFHDQEKIEKELIKIDDERRLHSKDKSWYKFFYDYLHERPLHDADKLADEFCQDLRGKTPELTQFEFNSL